jgi:hypothetical protein
VSSSGECTDEGALLREASLLYQATLAIDEVFLLRFCAATMPVDFGSPSQTGNIILHSVAPIGTRLDSHGLVHLLVGLGTAFSVALHLV